MPKPYNQRIVEAYFRAWKENDQEALKQLIDDAASFPNPPPGFSADKKGALELTEAYHQAFQYIDMELDHWVVGKEGRVAVHFKGSGDHTGVFLGLPASNKHVEAQGIAIVTVKDGKIIEDLTEVDRLGMLEQIDAEGTGGSEVPAWS
jgi:predicted ester cyclase